MNSTNKSIQISNNNKPKVLLNSDTLFFFQ